MGVATGQWHVEDERRMPAATRLIGRSCTWWEDDVRTSDGWR